MPLTLQVAEELEAGTAQEVLQDDSLATHVGKLSKENGWIPWGKPAVEVERHIRGMQPWPGPFTLLVQQNRSPLRMQILQAGVCDSASSEVAGTVIGVTEKTVIVLCGAGVVEVLRLQPDGKRPMAAADFLRGHLVRVGDRFESGAAESPAP